MSLLQRIVTIIIFLLVLFLLYRYKHPKIFTFFFVLLLLDLFDWFVSSLKFEDDQTRGILQTLFFVALVTFVFVTKLWKKFKMHKEGSSSNRV